MAELKKIHLTDSRASLKFHFNVRLHVGWLVGENKEEAGESSLQPLVLQMSADVTGSAVGGDLT